MATHTLAKQPSGQFQMTFTIPQADIEKEYQKVLKEAAKHVTVQGFRKGKAPLNKAQEKLDPTHLYEKVIENLLPEIYTEALKKEDLKPIISPQVRLLSGDIGQDWQVEATACELPKVDLKDSLKSLKGLLKGDAIWTPEKGDAKEKQEPTKDDKLDKIITHLLEKSEVEIPPVLVQQETDRELSRLIDQIKNLGLQLDQYLSSTGKTHETLRQDYEERIANELKTEFIVGKIADTEKLQVTDEEINQLIDANGDEQLKKAISSNPQARMQVQISILKRKTFDHLLSIAE